VEQVRKLANEQFLEREGRVKKKENVVKEREGEMSAAAEEVRGREVKVKDEEKLMQMWKQEVKTHCPRQMSRYVLRTPENVKTAFLGMQARRRSAESRTSIGTLYA
jgi:acetolactate synthase small subunit